MVHAQEYDLLWKYETDGMVESVAITPDGNILLLGVGITIFIYHLKNNIKRNINDTKSIILQMKSKYNVEEAESLLTFVPYINNYHIYTI